MSTDAPLSAAVSTPPAPATAALDTSALPDDLGVCHQMIAELLRELRRTRRDQEALQQRLDALLRRLYGPRPQPVNPAQPLLFAEEAPPRTWPTRDPACPPRLREGVVGRTGIAPAQTGKES